MALVAKEQVVTLSPASNILSTSENPLISNEKFRNLYLAMRRLRGLGELDCDRIRKQRRGVVLQEASIVGCVADLSPEDTLTATTDLQLSIIFEMAVQNVPGAKNLSSPIEPKRSASQPSRKTSDSRREVGLPHSIAGIAFAVGMASLHAAQGKGRLVLAFVSAKQMAGSRETLKFAGQSQLPIIFVQLDRSQNGSGARKSRASNTIPSIPVDKADVVAVHRVASEAIDKARRGAGPTIIDCVHYRVAGTKQNARTPRDPLIYMEAFLRKKNLWTDDLQRDAHGLSKHSSPTSESDAISRQG